MNQDEVKNNFEIERKKHFEFFLPYYQEKNWQVIEDNINSGQKNDWDVKLEISAGEYRLVDEKARIKEYNDFLLEIIQDMPTGKLGWFFSKKDWILYASWNDLTKNWPASLYLISSARLKNFINNLTGIQKTCISKKGWGNTWNIIMPWNKLIENKIAKKLI